MSASPLSGRYLVFVDGEPEARVYSSKADALKLVASGRSYLGADDYSRITIVHLARDGSWTTIFNGRSQL